jgi:glucose-6-phosphate isomerase
MTDMQRKQILERLKGHAERLRSSSIQALFNQRNNRFEVFSQNFGHGLYDYSKTLLDEDAFSDLLELARLCRVETHRDKMFAGEAINKTENRSVLHVALRAPNDACFFVDGKNVMTDISSTRDAFLNYAEDVRQGRLLSSTGKRFTSVIHIGIGGSDLGPRMAVKALEPLADDPRCHFVSNVDPDDMSRALAQCQPDTTLILIASKTFTTQETMANAKAAKSWLIKALGEATALALTVLHCQPIKTQLKLLVLQRAMFLAFGILLAGAIRSGLL